MFDEDGSLDPTVKVLLYAVLALAVGRMIWEWLTDDLAQLITEDLWGVIIEHPWQTGLAALGGLTVLLLLAVAASSPSPPSTDGSSAAGSADEAETLTFRMKQLGSMTATGFEQACAELLARDGFRSTRRVGGAGDLGADVTARDGEDRLLILQCKQYQNPVGSEHVQRFNGTVRLHHGADVPIMVALNGFTQPALDFARHHRLILVGRPQLEKWAHGQHLYDVIDIHDAMP